MAPGPASLRLTRSQLLESFLSQSRPAFLVMRHQDLGRQVHGFVNDVQYHGQFDQLLR